MDVVQQFVSVLFGYIYEIWRALEWWWSLGVSSFSAEMCHLTGAISRLSGIIVLVVSVCSFPSYILERVSALVFLEPGWYMTLKWKRVKKTAR